MPATIVDTDALLRTIATALIGGVGVTFVFSVAILGAARFTEASRNGRSGEALWFASVAVLGLIATAAAIVIGVIAMTSK